MGKVVYTIGYGNSAPEDFVNRLKDAGIDTVIDVRYYKAARLSCYRATGDSESGMANLLAGKQDESVISGIDYMWAPELGKPKEVTMDEFRSYDLTSETSVKFLGMVAWWVERRNKVCLLCAERDAYKDGAANCHRVYVADALVELLGEGWSVKHI